MLDVMDSPTRSALSRTLLKEVQTLANQFQQTFGRMPSFMEVCGSHTMALARTGVKKRSKDTFVSFLVLVVLFASPIK